MVVEDNFHMDMLFFSTVILEESFHFPFKSFYLYVKNKLDSQKWWLKPITLAI
jgi:hypothetical protein